MEAVNHRVAQPRHDPTAPAPIIKTLTFTTLFPNATQPVHGIFVANRLEHLLATGRVATEIVAPIPWFPFSHSRFGVYARYAVAPRLEKRFGSSVIHPRFFVIPKIGTDVAPFLLYQGARRTVAEILQRGFDFDVIDAHYFYPDGVAAILLGREFGKPVTITARGTDINKIADYWLPRRMILWAAREAAAVITVCQALKNRLVELDVAADRIRVLRNGVDLALFRPQNRGALRAKWGLSGRVILSVGHLIPRKGHDIAIDAVAALKGASLLIAGDGPERASLVQHCDRLGLGRRVRFLGQVAPSILAELYAAADVLVLASSHEGWANVLLEAMACGTPVVASNVWGTPEVVAERAAGLLVEERTGPAFAGALTRLFNNPPDRAATRAYAERFSWDATTAGQLEIFQRITART
jgi:teichuronic acid biosynthesis glycosyltransferase TuaC